MEARSGGVLRGLRARRNGTGSASGARYGLFASLKNGMQTLSDVLERKLVDGGVVIRKNSSVNALHQDPGGRWVVTSSNGAILEAEAVCLALPAYATATLLRSHDGVLADLLEGIPYSGSATINLAFRRSDVSHPLDGFGFVVPHAEKRFLLAATFTHQKFEGRVPGGCILIRGFVGGVSGEHVLTADDGTLERRALQDLHDLLGLRDSPLFCVVRKHQRSLPQYTVGHLDRLTEIENHRKALSGLTLAGNWMNGVGIPDCVESGEKAAKELVSAVP
jgi:oxygen-dependent protoporphyrinogen oxidase